MTCESLKLAVVILKALNVAGNFQYYGIALVSVLLDIFEDMMSSMEVIKTWGYTLGDMAR